MNADSNFVDLTNSFTLADHCSLANVVIELLTDDSIIEDNVPPGNSTSDSETGNSTSSQVEVRCRKNPIRLTPKKHTAPKKNKTVKKKKLSLKGSPNNEKSKFGCCPICWEDLGKKPLVSTKCGHIFCLHCLEKSLTLAKSCPTCRTKLNTKTSYHPLYLPV